MPPVANMNRAASKSVNRSSTPIRAGSIALVVAGAAILRVPALFTDLWFDEILSYERFARHATSIADIFVSNAFKHDNNHHLNTLTLYLLGEQTNWTVYRLPALVCGLFAVAAATVIGNRRSRSEGLISGTLVAASLLIVVYSTEARGYAGLLAFASIGFLALARFLDTGGPLPLVMFWASVAGGLASHGTMLHFYLGAVAWSGWRLRADLGRLARLHAVPALWILVWFFAVVRGGIVGGGPDWTWNQILDESLAWTFGYPLHTVPVALCAVVLVATVVWDARRLWREGSDEGFFYIGSILAPVVLMAALSPPYLFPRYFLVSLFFLLIVIGRRLAEAWVTSGRARWTVAAVLLLFVLGNATQLTRFIAERRHSLAAAIRTLAVTSSDRVVVTSRSLDRWTALPLEFYGRRLGIGGRIIYIPRDEVAARAHGGERIDWVIEPSQPCLPTAPSQLDVPWDGAYVLRHAFPICGPSGMTWSLYARAK